MGEEAVQLLSAVRVCVHGVEEKMRQTRAFAKNKATAERWKSAAAKGYNQQIAEIEQRLGALMLRAADLKDKASKCIMVTENAVRAAAVTGNK
jgi:hypothetical protein